MTTKALSTKTLILVLTAILIIPYIGETQTDDSLVVYLPFDSGSGKEAKDVTLNENNGQFVGQSDVSWVEGKFDGGIELDGQNYVDIPWSDSIDVSDKSFSLEIWFKYEEASSNGVLVWGYDMGAGAHSQFWFRTEPSANRIRGLINDGAGANIIVATSDPYNDGEWHHMAVVRDAETDSLTLYIDAKMEASETGEVGSVTETQTFGIQLGRKSGNSDMLKGSLDEFRLWTRALSEDEIRANMTKGKGQLMAVHLTESLTTTWGNIKKAIR